MAKSSKKKTKVRVEAEGQAHIQATFNNIIISLTNNKGHDSWLGFLNDNSSYSWNGTTYTSSC